jgi:hypothetical protein
VSSSSSSRQSSRISGSSSHVGQAEGTRPRAVRVTTLTSQVRTSDTRWSHTATADTATEESCSRRAHREREQQALDPQLPRGPRAEALGVYLRDLRHLSGPKIRWLRSVPED